MARTLEAGASHFAWSPDGTSIAVPAGDFIEVIDALSGASQVQLPVPVAALIGGGRVIFSPDGVWLAYAGIEDHIAIWHFASGELAHTIDNAAFRAVLRDIEFSRDGHTLAGVLRGQTLAGSSVELWSVPGWQHSKSLALLSLDIAYSPRGEVLAIGGASGSAGANPVVQLWEIPAYKLAGELHLPAAIELASFSAEATKVVISPDGEIVGALAEERLFIWTSGTYFDLPAHLTERTGSLSDVAFSTNGLLAVIDRDGLITLLNVETWEIAGKAQFVFNEPRVFQPSLQFSPAGDELAVGSFGSSLQIWRVPLQSTIR